MKRALRRKHYHRLKERWRKICINEWKLNDMEKIEIYAAQLARTRKPCSRQHKGLSRKERIANDILNHNEGESQ